MNICHYVCVYTYMCVQCALQYIVHSRQDRQRLKLQSVGKYAGGLYVCTCICVLCLCVNVVFVCVRTLFAVIHWPQRDGTGQDS